MLQRVLYGHLEAVQPTIRTARLRESLGLLRFALVIQGTVASLIVTVMGSAANSLASAVEEQ